MDQLQLTTTRMKKILATLMLGAVAFSSCIKEDDTYKDLLPVQPGQYIQSYVTTQNRVAMQAANAGMRVAVLAAEVAKQHAEGKEDVTLSTAEYNSRTVLSRLFNSAATIEEVTEGYKLTFNKYYQMPDGFYLSGSLVIRTGGADQLTDGAVWNVEMQPDFKLYSYSSYGNTESQINMNGGVTRLSNNGDGSYTIRLTNIAAAVEGIGTTASNWSTEGEGFVMRPRDAGVTLAYSSCAGKVFEVEGAASGTSIYTNIYGTGPISMEYRVTDALYVGQQIVSGTQECGFTSLYDYDTSAYPAPDVRYVYTFDEANSKYSFKIYYNGYTYPKE